MIFNRCLAFNQRRQHGEDTVTPILKRFIEHKMSFHSNLVFDCLYEVKEQDSTLLMDLRAFLETEVIKLDAKRGSKALSEKLRRLYAN